MLFVLTIQAAHSLSCLMSPSNDVSLCVCVHASVCPSSKPPTAPTHGQRVSQGLLHKTHEDVAPDLQTQTQEELLLPLYGR